MQIRGIVLWQFHLGAQATNRLIHLWRIHLKFAGDLFMDANRSTGSSGR